MAFDLKWFRILRPINLLLFILGQILAFYHLRWNDYYVDITAFILLVTSSTSVAAFSNIYNDLIDLPADLINKPHKIYLSPESKPLATYYLLFWMSIGVISTLIYLIRSENSWVSFFIFIQFPLSVWYSSYLKKTPIGGNLLIAIQCILVLLIVYWNSVNFATASSYFTGQIYFLLGFIGLTTLTRELTKDVVDISGDKITGAETFPIRFGYLRANTLIKFYLILIIGLLLWMASIYSFNLLSQSLYLLLGLITVALFYLSYKLRFTDLSLGLKYFILMGILSFAFLFYQM